MSVYLRVCVGICLCLCVCVCVYARVDGASSEDASLGFVRSCGSVWNKLPRLSSIISTEVDPGAAGTRRGDAGGTGGAQRRDSGGGAGESAGLTKMAAAMERFVEVVKQYPGQQQVDLAVEIEVPGSWFGAGPMGSLTATEQREKYKAQAVEYAEVHEFPGASKGARKTREKAIRFICITDATDEPNSEGYWMKLSQWNRYRNDTFKDRREDELAFIPGQAPATEGGVVENLKAPQTPSIKTVFTLKSEGVHIQRNGHQVQCFWWTCAQKGCKLDGRPIKEICKGTGSFSDT